MCANLTIAEATSSTKRIGTIYLVRTQNFRKTKISNPKMRACSFLEHFAYVLNGGLHSRVVKSVELAGRNSITRNNKMINRYNELIDIEETTFSIKREK